MMRKSTFIAICVHAMLLGILLSSCGAFSTDKAAESVDSEYGEIESDSAIFYIPFRVIDDRIVIRTKLNGLVNASLIVDNGAWEPFLTMEFAKKYANILNMSICIDTPGMATLWGPRDLKSCVGLGVFSYHFGDSIFPNYNTCLYSVNNKATSDYVLILNESIPVFPEGVDGIIPLQALAQNGLIKINFDKKRIEFPNKIDSLAVAYSYDVVYKLPVMQLPITFYDDYGAEKTYTLSALLDMGYPSSKLLLIENGQTKDIIRWLNTSKSKNTSSLTSDSYFVDRMLIGKDSTLVKNVIITPRRDNVHFDIMLGMKFISNYDLYFDYINRFIYIKPLTNDLYFLPDPTSLLYGIIVTPPHANGNIYSDDFNVVTVINDIAKIDIKLGDKLLMADHINIKDVGLDSLKKMRIRKEIPQKTVTVKRGKDTLILHRIKD